MNDLTKEIIVLKSVYDKSGIVIYTNPCKDPKTGRYPDCVKPVNSQGDIIITDAERNSGRYFIKETDVFTLEHGTTFDLNDPISAAQWEAVKHNPLIAPSRDAKDSNGNYIIDGGKRRYGRAELYVEKPGYESEKKISKKKKIANALNFIFDDSLEGKVLKCKLLGRYMDHMPDADVTDYLIQTAEKDPDKVIDLYTGTDTNLRLLFVDAKQKHSVYMKNKLYMYGDDIVLGATDDAVITWMKDPKHKKIVQLIQKDTYPEFYSEDELDNNEQEVKSKSKSKTAQS